MSDTRKVAPAQAGYYSLFYQGLLLLNHLRKSDSFDEKEESILLEHLDFYWNNLSQSQRDDHNLFLKNHNNESNTNG